MNRQIFSEKMTESVKIGKFDGNNRKTSNIWAKGESKRIKKIRPYYLRITLNLIVIDVNVQLSQTENAHLTIPTSYKINYCYLLVLQHCVRIFEISHWRLIHTGILTIIHTLWSLPTHK